MENHRIPLRSLLLLAQRDVQQVLEYLATPEARRVAPDAPAAVLATVGRLKMTVPVTYDLAGPQLAADAPPPAPGETARGGGKKSADSGTGMEARMSEQVPEGLEILVATPESCQGCRPHGTIEVEFITCPKKYG